ncbi:hypothetical protein F4804DRAFT_331990 [Jackrogersella minutella]|nr:hypothetical protein F4804DRAFT_331990 [Jackrogersella minutella]
MANTKKSKTPPIRKVDAEKMTPQGLEDTIPDSIHPPEQNASDSTTKTHAKGDGEESILPKKVQEKVPESIERAVPNAIHDTGDK